MFWEESSHTPAAKRIDSTHIHSILSSLKHFNAGPTFGHCTQPQGLPHRLHQQHCTVLQLEGQAHLLHQPASSNSGHAWLGNRPAEDCQVPSAQFIKWYVIPAATADAGMWRYSSFMKQFITSINHMSDSGSCPTSIYHVQSHPVGIKASKAQNLILRHGTQSADAKCFHVKASDNRLNMSSI